MLAAGIDVKIVSGTLGHSDTRITRDIYQSVLPHVGRSAGEATAKLVPLQRKIEAEEAARKAEKARKKGRRAKKAQASTAQKPKPKRLAKQGLPTRRSRSAHASDPLPSQAPPRHALRQQKTPGHGLCDLGFHRAPCRIRTDDLRITSALLWPD